MVFVSLAYVIPLIGNMSLLFTIQLCILTVFVVVLFVTQPPISFREARKDKNSDKLSVVFIVSGFLLGQLGTIIEWAYYSGFHRWIWDKWTLLGLGLMICGTIFRVWCIRVLGKFFTATVTTQDNQQIITTGPYKFIRHPSYTGAFIAAVGSSLFMHAFTAVLLQVLILGTVYYFRIKAEEETLIREFGDEYRNYQARTRKIVPGIY